MTRMNPDIKARWVAALRSGEYKQGHDLLRRNDEFCCLGVLCDLHAREAGGKWDPRDDGSYHYQGNYRYAPPISVWDWMGAPPTLGVEIGGVSKEVAIHNDEGRTFAEIADAIEEQL